MKNAYLVLLLTIVSVLSFQIEARPHYAAREKLNCIQCHASPWGGGHRKMSGKIYGADGLEGSVNNDTDRYAADIRMLFLKATQETNQDGALPNGVGLMTAQASGYVPIVESDEYLLSVLGNYDLGSFDSGAREVYGVWENFSGKWYKPTSIVAGKFYMPFGLLHDEHRTYTKMQSASGLREYDVGAVFSFDPLMSLHIDVGYVDGSDPYRKGPSTLDNNNTFGTVTNIRFNHNDLPFMLGASHLSNQTEQPGKPNPYAYSAYGVFSFSRIFDGFNLDILSEVVFARHYNVNENPYMSQFIPNSPGPLGDYRSSIVDKASRGILAEVRYEWSPKFTLLYKFDHLAFDENFSSDAFIRHGLGFRYKFDPNTFLLVKLEEEEVKIPNFDDNLQSKFDQGNILAVLRLWF